MKPKCYYCQYAAETSTGHYHCLHPDFVGQKQRSVERAAALRHRAVIYDAHGEFAVQLDVKKINAGAMAWPGTELFGFRPEDVICHLVPGFLSSDSKDEEE